ncbi:MAG: segregation/condensation protein A [Elusimicrobiota bacterium]|nr:segregation/condensation protein A [Elusimicrobiota bacterium]
MNGKNYIVRLEAFEGPLDLLLWLVQNNNMDIYDIEISKITTQYLSFVQTRNADLNAAADFLSMASLLMRIKSSLMLPKESEEYQEAMEQKRDLSEKLAEWKKIKESRGILLEKHQSRKKFFRRDEPAAVEIDKKSTLSVFELADIFANLVKTHDRNFDTITGPEIYLEDVKTDMLEKLKIRKEIKISEMLRSHPSKLYLAVLVLAVLDLAHDGIASLKQERPFAEIYLTSRETVRQFTGTQPLEENNTGEGTYGNS